jgi:hypothetical protein
MAYQKHLITRRSTGQQGLPLRSSPATGYLCDRLRKKYAYYRIIIQENII